MLFYEALTCSRMLEIIDPTLILIDPFLKKIHSLDFWLWRLFYQPIVCKGVPAPPFKDAPLDPTCPPI